jgi:glycosyltransferase involved in cell wall biosynthesis
MIVQALPPLPSGGAEIQALRLASKLSEKGIKILFLSPGVGKVKGKDIVNGITCYRLHSFLNYLVDFLFFIQKKSLPKKTTIEYDDVAATNNVISKKVGIGARLRYLVFLVNAFFFILRRRKKIGLLHVHTIEWPAYVASRLSRIFRIPVLVKDSTMNGITNILRFPDGKKKQQLIIRQSFFVAMTDCIYRNFVSAGVPGNKIVKIPNGIEIEKDYKQQYGTNSTVLFVGNLYQQPAKGIDILLKAWTKIIASVPHARLLVAGDGDIAAYVDYVNKLGIGDSVKFLGKNNSVKQLMFDADVFVLPSRREGMPNALMEAMMRSMPCVATDISGCQDLIEHNKSGILVPVGEAQPLAEAIVLLLTDPQLAANLGNAARQRVESFCDINNVAQKYLDVYSKTGINL